MLSDAAPVPLLYVTTAIASGLLGYVLAAGTASPSQLISPPQVDDTGAPKQSHTEDDDSSDDEEDIADGDLKSVKARFAEPCKLVLVVRTDLKMTPGKIAAQCSHATLACYKALVKANPQLVQHWERTGQAKIALRASSEEELLELEAIAKSLNLCARSIQDALSPVPIESGAHKSKLGHEQFSASGQHLSSSLTRSPAI